MSAQTIFLLARRELAGYFRTMTGYVIIALALLIEGVLFNAFAMGNGEKKSTEVLAQFFYISSGITMVGSVFISMRLLAEERQTGTIALLYSSPVRDVEIVLGKFLSALGFVAVMTLATFYMPLLVLVHGKLSIGQIAVGYVGLLLLGSASLAIGTLGSALARNQVLAAIISGCITVALVVCWLLAGVTERPLSQIFTAMSLHAGQFQPFMAGILALRSVVYYVAVTYVFLFAATRVLEARRWR